MSDICVRNLHFGYDSEPVLAGIDLDYDRGDFLGIIGPNGGGKSTFMRLLLGLLRPNSGTIEISPDACPLGYVPQQIPVSPSFPITALEVALMGRLKARKFGTYARADRDKARHCLDMLGIGELASRPISALSGGQRQRVYIARALCSDARVLLLDEPLSNIDAIGQSEIYDILNRLHKGGLGIIIICHDLNIAIHYATKIAHINKNLVMHDVASQDSDFLRHLQSHKDHFCDVELILKECSCTKS